jgi:hypothetical protein
LYLCTLFSILKNKSKLGKSGDRDAERGERIRMSQESEWSMRAIVRATHKTKEGFAEVGGDGAWAVVHKHIM